MMEPRKYGHPLAYPKLLDKSGQRLAPGETCFRSEFNQVLAVGYLWEILAPEQGMAQHPLRARCLTQPGYVVDLDKRAAKRLVRCQLGKDWFQPAKLLDWYHRFERNGIWLACFQHKEGVLRLQGYCPRLELLDPTRSSYSIQVSIPHLEAVGLDGEQTILSQMLAEMVRNGAAPV